MTANTRARFHFKHPSDMLKKLRFDIERLRAAQANRDADGMFYATMDACVTAVAVRDWLKASGDITSAALYKEIPGLRTVVEVANGMKHFNVEYDPLAQFATGGVTLKSVGGKPFDGAYFTWIGHREDTHLALSLLEEVYSGLSQHCTPSVGGVEGAASS